MKTKYIISGGYANRVNSDNDMFFREILKDTADTLKVLVILFAKPDVEAENRYMIVRKQFKRNKNDKKLEYVLATRDNFIEQIKKSDIIYIHGGETMNLINEIKKCADFALLVKGKVIAGESAGSYLLSSIFYSKTIGHLEEVLGILPIKVICHFAGLHVEKLDSIRGDLEKALLKDYQYKVYSL